ncbi:MAG: MBL fold metallo-hydrolase [Candidatus Aenigmarchaeota archaeon]|nr:MBL fold metallo-hydrolase [Candidatus Aenigmarchaeota archaeon]
MANVLDNLTWLGHSSFSLKIGNNIVFIDPYNLKKLPKTKPDVIFVTHAHFDHWSPPDIRKILADYTVVVGTIGCENRNLNMPDNRFIVTEPGKEKISGIKVKTIPAYNIKQERLNFHPKANKWVGYIFDVGGSTVYHAGDTDFIPEMKNLPHIDVAMLPIGGTYTMDVKEAIEAANAIHADVTIPIHYKRLLGNRAMSAEDEFVSGVKGKVVIMNES